ncbi:MAG: AAA family ATPase [Trebonia sp.]
MDAALPFPAIVPHGELSDLVTAEYPDARLSDLLLAPAVRAPLERVLHGQRQRGLLESRGFAPIRRLLLTGPVGTGKSMTASALAAELSLPLVTIRVDALISMDVDETAAKLRVVFDVMTYIRTRAAYLFDDFYAGGQRAARNDIREARRALGTLLWFLDATQPESLVVAAIIRPSVLGNALIRRFDSVITYALPDSAQAIEVLRRRLGTMNTSQVSWSEVGDHVVDLSHAELVRAAESAARRAILDGDDAVSTAALVTSLGEYRSASHDRGTG